MIRKSEYLPEKLSCLLEEKKDSVDTRNTGHPRIIQLVRGFFISGQGKTVQIGFRLIQHVLLSYPQKA